MKTILNQFLVFIMLSTNILAQTNVSGLIDTNTTWTKTNSPYILTGNLSVTATLTIEPGVVVKCNEGKTIWLSGRINALGTVYDSVYFIGNEDFSWSGFYTTATTDPDTLLNFQFVVVENAASCFVVGTDMTSTKLIFDHCRFSKNSVVFGWSARSYTGWKHINNCLFSNNHTVIGHGSVFFIKNCEFLNNVIGIKYANGAIEVENSTFSGHSELALEFLSIIRNCTFTNNATAVRFPTQGLGPQDFTNNIIKDNQVGIEVAAFPDSLTVSYSKTKIENNTICHNSVYNVNYSGLPSPGVLPQKIDFTKNCWCSSDSLEIESTIRDAKDTPDPNIGWIKIDPDNCSLTQEISISGNVHLGSSVLSKGIVTAINLQNGYEYHTTPGQNGEFSFNQITAGTYKLKVIPADRSLPVTYYPNKTEESKAAKINLSGKIEGIDIYLVTLTGLINNKESEDTVIEKSLPIAMPNPFSHQIEINDPQAIAVRDINGAILYETKGGSEIIQTENWLPGIYVLRSLSGKVFKIVKTE